MLLDASAEEVSQCLKGKTNRLFSFFYASLTVVANNCLFHERTKQR